MYHLHKQNWQLFKQKRGTLPNICEKWGAHTPYAPGSYVYDMTQCKDGVTCADMLILRMLNTLGSSFSRAVWATEVFPVPTGPVRSTGRFALINVDTKKSYRNVSTVGTTIL